MIAASFWSLLSPSINYVEMQNEMGLSKNLPYATNNAIGFFLGSLFLYALDKMIPHLHIFSKKEEAEVCETNWKNTLLFIVLAIACIIYQRD